ncbi:uncharacterized protein LOC144651972 [Oculina patagonica]
MASSLKLLICISMVALLIIKTEGQGAEGDACGIAGLQLGTCASQISCLDAQLNCANGLRCCRGNAVDIKAKNEDNKNKNKGKNRNKKKGRKNKQLYSDKIPIAAADYSIFEDES